MDVDVVKALLLDNVTYLLVEELVNISYFLIFVIITMQLTS